ASGFQTCPLRDIESQDLMEHIVIVLALGWRWEVGATGRGTEMDVDPGVLDAAISGVVDGHNHVPGAQMWVIIQVFGRCHNTGWHPGILQDFSHQPWRPHRGPGTDV